MEKIPIWEKLNLTINEAAEYSNIGIDRIRKMTKDIDCPFVLFVGRKTLIKRKEFERFITRSFEL